MLPVLIFFRTGSLGRDRFLLTEEVDWWEDSSARVITEKLVDSATDFFSIFVELRFLSVANVKLKYTPDYATDQIMQWNEY